MPFRKAVTSRYSRRATRSNFTPQLGRGLFQLALAFLLLGMTGTASLFAKDKPMEEATPADPTVVNDYLNRFATAYKAASATTQPSAANAPIDVVEQVEASKPYAASLKACDNRRSQFSTSIEFMQCRVDAFVSYTNSGKIADHALVDAFTKTLLDMSHDLDTHKITDRQVPDVARALGTAFDRTVVGEYLVFLAHQAKPTASMEHPPFNYLALPEAERAHADTQAVCFRGTNGETSEALADCMTAANAKFNEKVDIADQAISEFVTSIAHRAVVEANAGHLELNEFVALLNALGIEYVASLKVLHAQFLEQHYTAIFDTTYSVKRNRNEPPGSGVYYDFEKYNSERPVLDRAFVECDHQRGSFRLKSAWAECRVTAQAEYLEKIKLRDDAQALAFTEAMRAAGKDADADQMSSDELTAVALMLGSRLDKVFNEGAKAYSESLPDGVSAPYLAEYDRQYELLHKADDNTKSNPMPLYDLSASERATNDLQKQTTECNVRYNYSHWVAQFNECLSPADQAYFDAIKFHDRSRVKAFEFINLRLSEDLDAKKIRFEAAGGVYIKLWNRLFAPN